MMMKTISNKPKVTFKIHQTGPFNELSKQQIYTSEIEHGWDFPELNGRFWLRKSSN